MVQLSTRQRTNVVNHRFKSYFASAIKDIVKNLEKIGFPSVKNFAVRLRRPGQVQLRKEKKILFFTKYEFFLKMNKF